MAKGYWVAHVDIDDMERYKDYIAANAAPFSDYGARFLVRGGAKEIREGQLRSRTVVIEFKDFATAKACYDSVAYQTAKVLRDPVSTGDMEIVEGYDG
ncbi:DUF1330 domain-containing protein [Tritonibacter horizontis]|uniref:DUF1330 domain-containing protein n=1 Tax=Tritonibacter horizontis TaxID=1768241 RepID=A0A132BTB6_9RHOB|nr:DUF1330 domain-containing protein [Tritonibacter horizontis]KUP91272.1 hypothetical protein TRIHO_38450 [Tritonibacter horizontis]